MGLISEWVDVTLVPGNYKYWLEKGYVLPQKIGVGGKQVYEFNTKINVKVCDLPSRSNAKVLVSCDYCSKEYSMTYDRYTSLMSEGIVKKCCCKDCKKYKIAESNLIVYGVEYITETEEFQEHKKQVFNEKYNGNPMKNPFIQNKAKITNIKRYGCEYAFQNEEIRKKAQETNLLKYGVPNCLLCPEIKEKALITMQSRYGAKYTMVSEELKEKCVQTMYSKGNKPASIQQNYIGALYHGEINYPIKYYNVDICLVDEYLVVEYDGSGHKMSIHKGMSEEEFEKKEIKRNATITYNGYKIMRIISQKDKLPLDEILLQMLNIARDWFDKNHHWINFDIDNSIIINSENPNGFFFDYGKLRKIKKGDIKEVG